MKRIELAEGVSREPDPDYKQRSNGPNPKKDTPSFLKTVNRWLAGVIIFLALFGIVNWRFQPDIFTGLPPGFADMDPLSGLCFICAACGLLALQGERKKELRANVFAGIVMSVAMFDIGDLLLKTEILESLLRSGRVGADGAYAVAGIPLNTAICFFLSGSGILLIDRRVAADKVPSQYMALGIGLAGLMATMTYLYRVQDDGIIEYLFMTGSSALCFILVALGILFVRPSDGFMKEFTGVFIGSSTARVLVPFAILVPILLGFIPLFGHWANIFSPEAGVLILVTSIIIVFLVLITFHTKLLNKHDEEEHNTATTLAEINEALEKRVLERTSDLVKSERQFRTLIENSSDILSLADENMQLIYRSPAAERILGWTMQDRLESKGSVGSTHPDDLEYLNKVIKDVLKHPGVTFPVTFRTKHKEGHYLWVEGVMTNMIHDESVGAIVTHFKDVTKEKIANDRFRIVVEGSPFGKILVNASGEITLVNSKTESLLGYERRELVGGNISTIMPTEYWRQLVAHATDNNLRNDDGTGVLGSEFIITRKNRSQFPVEIALNPIEAGEGLMLLVSLLDITSRKNTESKLAQRTTELREAAEDLQLTVNRFRRTEEIARIGHWLIDIATQETVWSDGTFMLLGLRPQECKPSIELFFRYIHPDDLQMVRSIQTEAEKKFSPFAVVHRVLINGGIEKHLYSVATYEFDHAGRPVRLSGASMDVTAVKQTESKLTEYHQRHELLSKATNEAIWDWDLKKNTVLWNHGIETIFGYRSRTLESTESWWQARIHPDDVQRIVGQIQKTFGNRESKLTLEYRYECADKSYKYVLDKAYVVYDEGQPVRVIGAMQDVTELMAYRRNLEKMVDARTVELNAALAKEKELVAVKSKFVSIASHEFRTPLSTIALAAGFVKRHKTKLNSAEIDRKLENIDKQVRQMTFLLDDILTIGKAEAGKLQVKFEEIDVNDLKKLAQEAIKSTATKHKLVYSQQCNYQKIITDEKLIRNIIINLVTNAVKFSPGADQILMDVNCDDEFLMIRVEDYGVGIPANDIPSLFNTFSRGSNVGEIAGTGLGLSIVQKAVDMLKGKVEVKSEEGKGTEFKIVIPFESPI